jgi:hypothetical protein
VNKKDVGEKPNLFSTEGQVDTAFIKNYEKNMADKHFKFIISPESQGVDVEALAKVLVRRMEAAAGYTFSWVGALHTDTAHKHVHLLINGIDKNGKDITFDRAFIKQTMREMAQDICTTMIGNRPQKEIQAVRERLPEANRHCYLDDTLKALAVYTDDDSPYQYRIGRTADTLLNKRLEYLARLGLARQIPGNRYGLEKDWEEKLSAMGRYNSFLKARADARFTPPYNVNLYQKEAGKIGGIVTKVYRMDDEDSWTHAVLIENKQSGQAWFAPSYFEYDGALLNQEVTCSSCKNKKGFEAVNVKPVKDQYTRQYSL